MIQSALCTALHGVMVAKCVAGTKADDVLYISIVGNKVLSVCHVRLLPIRLVLRKEVGRERLKKNCVLASYS